MAQNDEAEQIEVQLVLEAIYQKYGYDFRGYALDSLRRRVLAGLARSGLDHLGELQHRLLVEPEFFTAFLNDLTVQVSDIFRDPDFYRAFRAQVVPLLRKYPRLKIWHAGCASGEEVYTTAILLAEEDLYERSVIYATDVSASAVERAREGVYEQTRVAAFTHNYELAGGRGRFADYYSSAYGGIALREGLRKNLVFFQHNLVSDYALGEMHVIFCRNVLIYFGATLRERVLMMFRQGLCRGGFLCLGASECLPGTQVPAFTEISAADRLFRLREEV